LKMLLTAILRKFTNCVSILSKASNLLILNKQQSIWVYNSMKTKLLLFSKDYISALMKRTAT
jgi:hypothetical protein